MRRLILLFFSLTLLVACNGASDLNQAPVPLGNFNLVHNIAVAPKAQKGPLSREVSKEALVKALTDATAERFGRYDGSRGYHFGMSVEGYVLAQPGIPVGAAAGAIAPSRAAAARASACRARASVSAAISAIRAAC